MFSQKEALPKFKGNLSTVHDENHSQLYKNILGSSKLDGQSQIIPDDDEEDEEDEEDDRIVDKSPNGRFQKRNQKSLRHVPGVDNVYIAIEPKSGKEVIWNEIILLKKKTDLENRLLSIIKMLKRNYHPFLVRFLEAWITKPGTSDSTRRLIFITERLDEGTLKQFMCNSHSSNRMWKRHIGQLMSVLLFFNKLGVNHGNLTNETIYYQNSGSLKIGIFAVDSFFNPKAVRNISETNRTRAFYLAPEYSDPDAKITSAADIYALGIIALEIAVSEPVFDEKKNNRNQTKLERIHQMLTMVRSSLQYDFIQACLRTRAYDRPSLQDLFCHPAMIEVPSLKLFSAKSVVNSIRCEPEETVSSVGELSQSSIFNALLREITSSLEDEAAILLVEFESDRLQYARYWKDFRSNFTITAKYLEDVRNGYYPFFGCHSSRNCETIIKANRYLHPAPAENSNPTPERSTRPRKTASVSQCPSVKRKRSEFRSLRSATDAAPNSLQSVKYPDTNAAPPLVSNESSTTVSARSTVLLSEAVPSTPNVDVKFSIDNSDLLSDKAPTAKRSFSTIILPSQMLLNDENGVAQSKMKKSRLRKNDRKFSSVFDYSTTQSDEQIKSMNRRNSLRDLQSRPIKISSKGSMDLRESPNIDHEGEYSSSHEAVMSPTARCNQEHCRTCYPNIFSEDSSEFDDSSSNLHRNESMNALGLDDEEEDDDESELKQSLDYLVPQIVHVSAPVPPAIPRQHRAVFTHCQYSYLGCGRWQVDVQMWFVEERLNREGCVQLYSHEWHDIEYVAEILGRPSSLHPEDRRALLKLLDYARHNYPLINGEIQPPNATCAATVNFPQYSSNRARAESEDEYSHLPKEENTYCQVRSSLDCYDLARRLNAVQLSENKNSYVCDSAQIQSECESTPNSSSRNSIINCFNKEFHLDSFCTTVSSSNVDESGYDSAVYTSCKTQLDKLAKCVDSVTRPVKDEIGSMRSADVQSTKTDSSTNSTISSYSSCIPAELEYLAPPSNPMCASCDRHDYLHKTDLPAYLTSPCYHCRDRLAVEANIGPETLLDLHLQHHIPWPAFLQAKYGIPPDSRSPQEILNYECKWRSRQPCLCFGDFEVAHSTSLRKIPIIFPPCVEFPWLYETKFQPSLSRSHSKSEKTSEEEDGPSDISPHMIDQILRSDHLPCHKRHVKGAPMICNHGYQIPLLNSNINRKATRW